MIFDETVRNRTSAFLINRLQGCETQHHRRNLGCAVPF
jgi:hypothetical protein